MIAIDSMEFALCKALAISKYQAGGRPAPAFDGRGECRRRGFSKVSYHLSRTKFWRHEQAECQTSQAMKAENAHRRRLLSEQLLEDDVLGGALCPGPDRKVDEHEWTLGCPESLGPFQAVRGKRPLRIRPAF